MNYDQAVEYIHSLLRFGTVFGLERIEKLLSRLGNPQKKLKFVHVAGTNGKGSVVAMCSKILQTAGYKTGMYISPFVLDFRERFQINSEFAEKQALAEAIEKVKVQIDALNSQGDIITEFEAVTAAALLYFAKENCDIVCLEVGLGGRYDATNVIDTPEVSVITSVSLDHMQVLGDTVEKIAFEKAGIIKPNGVTVTYPLQDEKALGVIMEKCAGENNRLIIPNAGAVEILKTGIGGSEFAYGKERYKLSLAGEHQVYNAVTALEVIKELVKKGFDISHENIVSGLYSAGFPARFELLSDSPLTILDGAHNFDGARALKKTLLDIGYKDIVAVTAMMADKEYEKSLGLILPMCRKTIAVKASNKRSLSAEELSKTAKKYCGDVCAADSVLHALKLAKESAGRETLILIFGSFYLAGDVKNAI